MLQPKQGILLHYPEDDRWVFSPGKKHKHQEIPLDLPGELNSLLSSGQLFPGHVPFNMVYGAQQALARVSKSLLISDVQSCARAALIRDHDELHPRQITRTIESQNFESLSLDDLTSLRDAYLLTAPAHAYHVSAASLSSPTAPSSLKHLQTYPASDKSVWLDAYSEEYDGLCATGTFDIISEDEYRDLKSSHNLGPILPSMALATIKYDSDGRPLRAKYRIVVLGNRDLTPWTSSDVSAPVMSSWEFRTLLALAIHHRRKLLQGDVKQAFLHSTLPTSDSYIVRPPANCPRSRPGTLWRLRKSLYGLRRAPRLWYETMTATLSRLGLQSLPNCPCLYSGVLLPGCPPIYLGLYVDDFVYFSPDPDVERKFESLLEQEFPVEFLGVAHSFLGLTMTWTETPTSLSVHLDQLQFTEDLLERYGMAEANPAPTPYRSGCHIDTLTGPTSDSITALYQSLVGSLHWLTSMTRPDLATVTHLLSKYNQQPTSAHLDAARYVLRYLAGTRTHGLQFTSDADSQTASYNHYPLTTTNTHLPVTHADANWGPQDASQPNPHTREQELPPHHTRSISGHVVFLMGGPVIWHSKRQSITALSTTEAEIYATTEATKSLVWTI
ncbi:MAG: transposon Pol polyprotein [Acidobacteria bacterium]|nr:transposon Pol polyprotein [Acidobacteriota bacterium]